MPYSLSRQAFTSGFLPVISCFHEGLHLPGSISVPAKHCHFQGPHPIPNPSCQTRGHSWQPQNLPSPPRPCSSKPHGSAVRFHAVWRSTRGTVKITVSISKRMTLLIREPQIASAARTFLLINMHLVSSGLSHASSHRQSSPTMRLWQS